MAGVAVTVDRVETVDARSGRVLAVLEGDAVAAVMRPFGGKPPGSTLQPSEAGVILLDATLPQSAPVPRTIAHDFSLTYASDVGCPRNSAAASCRSPGTVRSWSTLP